MKTYLNTKCGLFIYKQALNIQLDFKRSDRNNSIAEKQEQGLERLNLPSPSRLSTIRAVRRSDPELEYCLFLQWTMKAARNRIA